MSCVNISVHRGSKLNSQDILLTLTTYSLRGGKELSPPQTLIDGPIY